MNHPALLAGNWSQLCATCKVPILLFCWFFCMTCLTCAILTTLPDAVPILFVIRLSDLFVQSTVPPVVDVLSSLTIIALGYLIALARWVMNLIFNFFLHPVFSIWKKFKIFAISVHSKIYDIMSNIHS